MVKYSIHREGGPSIAWISLLLILVGMIVLLSGSQLWILWLLLFACFCLWVAVVSFFRIPHRKFPDVDEGSILAPADGRVVDITEIEEPEYFKQVCTKISVFMSATNVHVNRYPVSGKVVYACYHPGKFLVAWHEKSSVTNEHNTVVIRTADGTDVLVRQIAGAAARRIVSYARIDKDVQALDELGFIKFGSRVDIFVPVGTRVCVEEGLKVRGGIDVLAEISR